MHGQGGCRLIGITPRAFWFACSTRPERSPCPAHSYLRLDDTGRLHPSAAIGIDALATEKVREIVASPPRILVEMLFHGG